MMRQPKLYYYGLWLANSGKECIFVCTTKEKIPSTATQKLEGVMLSERAYVLANELKLGPAPRHKFRVGDIVIYADRHGQHTALVLHKGNEYSTFLFVTSNPDWNENARAVTKKEESLLGYPDKGTISYFAPVVRYNEYAVETGKSYPTHRVKDLVVEFEV